MTIGSDSTGAVVLTLSERESEDFRKFKKVTKLSGDDKGPFRVHLKMTRDNNPHLREAMGYENKPRRSRAARAHSGV